MVGDLPSKGDDGAESVQDALTEQQQLTALRELVERGKKRETERATCSTPGVDSIYIEFDWPTCATDGCFGVRLAKCEHCLEHARDSNRPAYDHALAAIRESGHLDIRGLRVSTGLLDQIVESAPNHDDGARYLIDVRCDAAIFTGDATAFRKVELAGDSRFTAACFCGPVAFKVFAGDAWFQDCVFQEQVGLDGCVFERDLRLDGSLFLSNAHFGATFKGDVGCPGVEFHDYAQFFNAEFNRPCNLGRIIGLDRVDFTNARFAEEAVLWIRAPLVEFSGTRFAGRASIHLKGGDVTLASADFRAPSAISDLSTEPLSEDEERLGLTAPLPMRLLTVASANVAELVLDGVDVSDCRFCGARGLDQLAFEGDPLFAVHGARWDWRRVLADEREWRVAHGYSRWQAPGWNESPQLAAVKPSVHSAIEIAETYRALRRGRESARDEPGGADFYYGEMEMRRLSGKDSSDKARGAVERALLTAYWLSSGYALRAARAVVCLFLTVVLFAAALWALGFHPRPAFGDALLFSAKSTSSLFRPPDELPGYSLTYGGQWMQLVLRLLGPLFFGLILLSLRGRVKR